jgi:hypothetical protein
MNIPSEEDVDLLLSLSRSGPSSPLSTQQPLTAEGLLLNQARIEEQERTTNALIRARAQTQRPEYEYHYVNTIFFNLMNLEKVNT